MNRAKLCAAIRTHKGPIHVRMVHRDCVLWVVAVKSDLIDSLCNSFSADAETSLILIVADGFASIDTE